MKKQKSKLIDFWTPKIGKQEHFLVKQVLKSNYLNDGEITTRFEEKIAKLVGCRNAVGVTSGTAGLFLALVGLGIGCQDEVIVPDITFIATANAVVLAGAKPVLADIDSNTLNIDPRCFKKRITKHTKAVIPVHVSGRAADLTKIRRIADSYGIFIVEDAAEAFMSRYKGRFLGTFGKAGVLSFSPNKIITTGQGGVILTDDDKLHMRLRELKDQGRPERGTGGEEIHNSIGYNFKLTNLQAAVGLGQLSRLNNRLKRMKQIYSLYSKNLEEIKELTLFKFDIKAGESPQWVDVIVQDRDSLYEYLLKKGIRCRKFWYPLHTQKPYRKNDKYFPVSSRLSKKAMWLPSNFNLSDNDILGVCHQIKKFYTGEA